MWKHNRSNAIFVLHYSSCLPFLFSPLCLSYHHFSKTTYLLMKQWSSGMAAGFPIPGFLVQNHWVAPSSTQPFILPRSVKWVLKWLSDLNYFQRLVALIFYLFSLFLMQPRCLASLLILPLNLFGGNVISITSFNSIPFSGVL